MITDPVESGFSNTPVDWQYIECGNGVRDIYDYVIQNYFSEIPELKTAKIRFIYFSKQKKINGKGVAAYVKKPSDLESYLDSMSDKNRYPSNYFIFIDYYVWNNLEEEYKVKLMRHEVRHIEITYNKEGDMVYGLKPHDFEDFEEDMEIESKPGGNPNWHHVLSDVSERVRTLLKESSKD